MSELIKGTVKFYKEDKGFGFIKPDGEGNDDIFFHANEVEASGCPQLTQGDRVTFTVKEGRKGPQVDTINFGDGA